MGKLINFPTIRFIVWNSYYLYTRYLSEIAKKFISQVFLKIRTGPFYTLRTNLVRNSGPTYQPGPTWSGIPDHRTGPDYIGPEFRTTGPDQNLVGPEFRTTDRTGPIPDRRYGHPCPLHYILFKYYMELWTYMLIVCSKYKPSNAYVLMMYSTKELNSSVL